MSEIDVILIELHRLLTEVKNEGGNDALHAQIQILFVSANRLIKKIDDHDKMEKVREEAEEIAFLAWQIFIGPRFLKGRERLKEFVSLSGIGTNEKEN